MAGAWRNVELDGQKSLFQMEVKKGTVGYTCFVTDLVNLYKEEIDKDGFIKKFSEINSEVEVDDFEGIFSEISSIMNNSDSDGGKLEGGIEGDSCDLHLCWESDGLKLKWMFQLVRQSGSEFHQHVTKSLLRSMALLLGERDELVSIIRSKDLEIEDYENSGAKLTRKALKTTWFKPELAFNETKPVELNNEIDFMTSSEIQNVMNKSVIKTTGDEVDLKVKAKESNEPASKTPVKEAKVILPPTLSSKRKVVKPDLNKIADRQSNKKAKLNSL